MKARPIQRCRPSLWSGGNQNRTRPPFSVKNFAEVSTKNGRKCVRVNGPGDGVVAVWLSDNTEYVGVASRKGNILSYPERRLLLCVRRERVSLP